MQDWIKTTKAQKQAWMLAEEGSYEDSGKARGHVYEIIRGSYWASLYLDDARIEPVVNSFVYSTFQDVTPRHWKKLAPQLREICVKFGRDDLAKKIDVAAALF